MPESQKTVGVIQRFLYSFNLNEPFEHVMTLTDFLNQVQKAPTDIEFTDTISVIETNYDYSPTAFKNGDTYNEAGTNEGSCKIFAFAKLNDLEQAATLALFGKYYREDVLGNPEGTDHANIRNFIQTGWEGIQFEGDALVAK